MIIETKRGSGMSLFATWLAYYTRFMQSMYFLRPSPDIYYYEQPSVLYLCHEKKV